MKTRQQYLPAARRNELELLICCGRARLDPTAAGRINERVRPDIDWDYLVETAMRHKMIPMLYTNLKKVCPEKIPAGIIKRLQTYYFANVARNLFLTGRLLKILKMLDAQGIEAIPFKGPVLAEAVYGDIALRQFADLDILVSPEDAIRTMNILTSENYGPEIRLENDQLLKYINDKNEMAFTSGDHRVNVDLHWALSKYLSVPSDAKALANRPGSFQLAGKPVKHLCREELLIFLCIHGASHCWEGLGHISDVAQTVHSNPEMDWKQVQRLAKRMQCRRILYLGLYLADDLWDLGLPDFIQEKINTDPKTARLGGKIFQNIFMASAPNGQHRISSRFSAIHLQVRETPSARIRFCLDMAFRPSIVDWRRYPLPAFFSFLRYGLRPIRLVTDYFKAAGVVRGGA